MAGTTERFAINANASRIKSRRTMEYAWSKSRKTGKKVTQLAVSLEKVVGQKNSGGMSVDRENPETEETNMTVENYERLLRKRLMKECQSYLNTDKLVSMLSPKNVDVVVTLRKRILHAIQTQRIFSIYGYYPIISTELKKRGWIEKRDPELKPFNYERLNILLSIPNNRAIYNVESPPSMVLMSMKALDLENIENINIWPMLKDVIPNYLFTTKRKYISWNTLDDTTTISQFAHLIFCTKVGLAQTIATISKKANIKFPRAYIISDQRTLNIFKRDFRFTAILGSLKKVLSAKNAQILMFNQNGTIPYEMIDFIEQRCWEFLNAYYQTEEINDILWFTTELEDSWNKFIVWYYEIVDGFATIQLSNSFQINDIYERFDNLTLKIKTICPQFFIDGDTNLWIIKPSNSCSGLGIKLERNFNNILKIFTEPNRSTKSYIVQKYIGIKSDIENPLTIFNVKVDLRQYILITYSNTIRIWMYKEGYVRFCSKEYSVKDLSKAVHLSNVKVQSDYRRYRVSSVPEECMWDFEHFKKYLILINKSNKWHTSIYPTICDTILTIIPEFFKQNNYNKSFSFQLLGADFILTDNFEPWLIEINSNPGLNPTTSIITKIATMLLKDIVKVTVDFAVNSNTDTGLFENIYTDKLVKHSNAVKKENTKEYYYYQLPKNIKQLNKQSYKGI